LEHNLAASEHPEGAAGKGAGRDGLVQQTVNGGKAAWRAGGQVNGLGGFGFHRLIASLPDAGGLAASAPDSRLHGIKKFAASEAARNTLSSQEAGLISNRAWKTASRLRRFANEPAEGRTPPLHESYFILAE
jgi:hypothetical protein